MRLQLIDLFEHALQKNLKLTAIPSLIKENLVFEKAESAINYQLASGMVDTFLGISKTAGDEIAKKDSVQEDLTTKALDRFWEELAIALESDSTLKNSQFLLVSILEGLKLSSINEIKSQPKTRELIAELDSINFNSKQNSANQAD